MTHMKFILITALTILVGSAFGQAVDGRQVVRAELITDAGDFTRPFTIGIQFTLEPDWYLYWKNPGDSGLPIDVQWDLPAGWEVSELRHPVPSKFAHDNVVSYGYKNEVVLLATVTPGSEKVDVVKARLDWLVCQESCIRGNASVTLPLNAAAVDDTMRASMVAAQGKFPVTMTVPLERARVHETDYGWTADVMFKGGTATAITDFYPEETKDIMIDYGSIRIVDGALQFRFERQNQESGVVNVRGLFIAGEKGFEGTIPLHF